MIDSSGSSNKKAIVLISSGLDSHIASYLLKDKLNLVFLHMYYERSSIEVVKEYIKKIYEKNNISIKDVEFYVVDFNIVQQEISKLNSKEQCILCKRSMIELCERIAKEKGIDFIVTGDSIAQVASQTIENMAVITKKTDKIILRPLLCYNKDDVIKISKEIGTFEISLRGNSPCPYLPKSPVTKTTSEKIEVLESKIDRKVFDRSMDILEKVSLK